MGGSASASTFQQTVVGKECAAAVLGLRGAVEPIYEKGRWRMSTIWGSANAVWLVDHASMLLLLPPSGEIFGQTRPMLSIL